MAGGGVAQRAGAPETFLAMRSICASSIFIVPPSRPFQNATISDMMLRAISSGVRPPRSRPTGERTCWMRSMETPRFISAS